MTRARILRSILLSAALALSVVGCPPEPPDDDDAGIGGSAATGGTTVMGGRATGGTATAGAGGAAGGTAVSVCQTVTTLPEQYSSCTNTGQSQCLPNGDRCVCLRNVWYCNTECANIPEPTPGTDCSSHRGAACNYANGAGCSCENYRWNDGWMCMGDSSSCPAGNSITTGASCIQPGIFCDYPDPGGDPLLHKFCACPSARADASQVSAWYCFLAARCPATQPVYPTACGNGLALCAYGTVYCSCFSTGNWICDWPGFPWFAGESWD